MLAGLALFALAAIGCALAPSIAVADRRAHRSGRRRGHGRHAAPRDHPRPVRGPRGPAAACGGLGRVQRRAADRADARRGPACDRAVAADLRDPRGARLSRLARRARRRWANRTKRACGAASAPATIVAGYRRALANRMCGGFSLSTGSCSRGCSPTSTSRRFCSSRATACRGGIRRAVRDDRFGRRRRRADQQLARPPAPHESARRARRARSTLIALGRAHDPGREPPSRRIRRSSS